MANVDKELSEKLKNWNPMLEAYNDSRFNKYATGPGADLDESLQPSEMAKNRNSTKSRVGDPYLVFRNVPNTLTTSGLINICSAFGKVVRGNKLNQLSFVNFASVNDMERAFTGLQDNSYGFTVHLGNNKKKDQNQGQGGAHGSSSHSADPLPSSSRQTSTGDRIDYERSYQVSSRNAPRPLFKKQPIVSKADYDNLNNFLSLVDPHKQFIIEDDSHELERLPYAKHAPVEDGKYNYYTGRAYYAMAEKDKRLIEEKKKTTIGSYDENKFTKPSPEECKKAKLGPCESCQNVCDTICARCSAFYCSTECQKKEWQKHRYYCGKPGQVYARPKPPQEESPPTHDPTQEAAVGTQAPESGSNVMLTAIIKSNTVFVRSRAYDDNIRFFKTVSMIQMEGKRQNPIQHTPQSGEIVLTKFKEQHYNRAMILNPDDLDNIKLIYMDYGNIDVKPLDDLVNAPDIFWHLPCMAVPIVLKDVPDFFMTDEVKKYMYTHLNTDLKIVYNENDVDKGYYRAELFDLTTNESFNKTIASFKASSTASDTSKAPVLYKNYLEQLSLPTGENVDLVVMDNSVLQTAFVSCSTKPYALAIQKFQDDIQEYAKANADKAPYTPRVDELCLAKYDEDGQWYRGRCIELVGDGHPSILFFDYGNISITSVENILRYPQEFTFPIMTFDCEISGLPEVVTDEIKKKLEESLPPGMQLSCEKVVKEEDIYTIHLPDIVKRVIS